jgi:shikimate dehydrogenase
MGFRGGNFTLPHKVAVIEHLDRLSEAAQLMGAVNCVSNENGALVGENTDGKGFVESLRQITDPTGKRIVLFGGGGAARAIAVELALAGVESMTIANRTAERGESLVALLNEKTETPADFVLWDSDFPIPEDADVVINATSIGLGAPQDRLPIVAESFCDSQVVADVVFNPVHTRFLKEARDQGCRTLDGLGMLVNQGVIGFQIWTGIEPDRAIMREALEEYLEI